MLTDEFLAPLNQAQDWAGLDALLLPMDYALAGLPRLTLEPAAVKRLRHGQTVLLTPAAGSIAGRAKRCYCAL